MDLQFANTHVHRRAIKVPMHTHPVLEVVYYTAGEGSSQIGRRRCAVVPGTITITPAGVSHDQLEKTPMSSLCFGVRDSGLEELEGALVDHGGGIGFIARSLMLELGERSPAYEQVADGLLRQLVGRLRRLASEPERRPRKEELVHQALGIIRQSEGTVTVAELSDILYISHDYLRHLFKEYSSQSPMQHIIQVRLDKAKHLLRDTDDAVAKVAVKAGFENPYYFSRLFRQVVGQTPTAFRRHA